MLFYWRFLIETEKKINSKKNMRKKDYKNENWKPGKTEKKNTLVLFICFNFPIYTQGNLYASKKISNLNKKISEKKNILTWENKIRNEIIED